MPIPYPRQESLSSSSSSASSESSYDEDEERALIQEEWEESLRQMEVVMSIIIMPFFGKWFGRQWAYWGKSSQPSLQLQWGTNSQLSRDIRGLVA
jgi:hypothetical protein